MNWWVAAFAIAIGLGSCMMGISMGVKAYRLRCYSDDAQGRVIDTRFAGLYNTNATVEFTDRCGQRVTFGTPHARKHARNDLVWVEYLPDNPRVAEVRGGDLIFDSVYCLAVGLTFLVWFFSELIAGRVG